MHGLGGELQSTLAEAADSLRAVQLSSAPPSLNRQLVENSIRKLSVQTATIQRLLDSAAVLYYGYFLHDGTVESGYASDGVPESTCAAYWLQMEG